MKKIILISLLIVSLFLSGCVPQDIKDIKNEEHIGKQVIVHGTVTSVISLGPLSGFILEDRNGDTISVSTKDLPAKGEEITVTGILIKDSIFQYYIKMNE